MQRTAELHITQTSPTCTRYTLVSAGIVLWINRVIPCPEGHAGARSRMAAWSTVHKVRVVEAVSRQPARVTVEVSR